MGGSVLSREIEQWMLNVSDLGKLGVKWEEDIENNKLVVRFWFRGCVGYCEGA